MLNELYLNNKNTSLEEILTQDITNHKQVASKFYNNLTNSTTKEVEVVELYQKIMDLNGIPTKLLPTTGPTEDIFYLNLIGQYVINERLDLHTKGMTTRLVN